VYGLMIGVDLSPSLPVGELIEDFIKHGVLTLRAGENTLRLAPPLVIEKRDIDRFMQIFHTLLKSRKGEKR